MSQWLTESCKCDVHPRRTFFLSHLCYELLQIIPWDYLGMTALGYPCWTQATSWTISLNAVIHSLIELATMRLLRCNVWIQNN